MESAVSSATTDGNAKTTNGTEPQTSTPAQTNGEINDITSDPLACTVAEKNVLNPPSPFYKIALTGGPCGGKTTALARLSRYLIERGFEVMTCPESFGMVVTNGMDLSYIGAIPGMPNVIQDTVMSLQITHEDGFEAILKARGKPSVLICDRGVMDGSVYMDYSDFERLVQKRGLEVCDVREGRYNCVFHMVSAAEGAEQHYTTLNNEVRSETPEEAREVDSKTIAVWVGHPNLSIFDNSTDFETKVSRIVNAAANLVGLPTNAKRFTKYLLMCEPKLEDFPAEVDYRVFEVEKVYLLNSIDAKMDSNENKPNKEYSFVRKRSQGQSSIYGQTTVTYDSSTREEIEVKRIIATRQEYNTICQMRDTDRHVLVQTRISFLWKKQSFAIHTYRQPVDNVCILYAQVNSNHDNERGDSTPPLPEFLQVERKLTNSEEDRKLGSYFISLKNETWFKKSLEKNEGGGNVENNTHLPRLFFFGVLPLLLHTRCKLETSISYLSHVHALAFFGLSPKDVSLCPNCAIQETAVAQQ